MKCQCVQHVERHIHLCQVDYQSCTHVYQSHLCMCVRLCMCVCDSAFVYLLYDSVCVCVYKYTCAL